MKTVVKEDREKRVGSIEKTGSGDYMRVGGTEACVRACVSACVCAPRTEQFND